MKITPVGNPASKPTLNRTQDTQAQDARARAIAKLVGNTPVQDASNVSPEEMTAVQSNTQQAEIVDETATTEDTTQLEASQTEEVTETTEAKVETEEAVDEAPLSKQYAILARREKALRAKQQQQEQSFKAREEALKAKEEALNSKSQSFDQSKYISKDRFKQDPMTVLLEAGITYDEITQQMLNANPADPQTKAELNALKEEIRALREANENGTKAQEQAQKKAYEDAVNNIRREAQKLVSNNPEFETIKATGSEEDVVELIKETWNRDQVLMTVEEAAQEVENYLIEEALKFSKIEKIKKRLMPASTATQKTTTQTPTSNQAPKQPQTMKTLTNSASTTGAKLSARERALLAFKGELK